MALAQSMNIYGINYELLSLITSNLGGGGEGRERGGGGNLTPYGTRANTFRLAHHATEYLLEDDWNVDDVVRGSTPGTLQELTRCHGKWALKYYDILNPVQPKGTLASFIKQCYSYGITIYIYTGSKGLTYHMLVTIKENIRLKSHLY